MQQFSNVAYDFSEKSINCSFGAGLLSNIFSEDKVKRISSSNEPLNEIRKAFSELLPFERNLDGENYRDYIGKKILDEVPNSYFESLSFHTGEVTPPFEMLENYVQTIAKREQDRVDRAEMYERELFIVDFSKQLFESNPNIGAICYFGSFARGRKNPEDIDIVFFLKKVQAVKLIRHSSFIWEGTKSKKLIGSKKMEYFRPDESFSESFSELDNAYCLIEDYQRREGSLFKRVADRNTYSKYKKEAFRVNAMGMPIDFDFSTRLISGGHIWVINSKENGNYKAFFSLGKEFSGHKLFHPEMPFVP